MNITEFLEARIAEDEAVAKEHLAALEREMAEYPQADERGPVTPDRILRGKMWAHYGGQSRNGAFSIGQHIASMASPARVLAECAAKRGIVNVYCAMAANHPADGSIGWYQVDAYETVLRTLAAVYADHPDYQQEWAL